MSSSPLLRPFNLMVAAVLGLVTAAILAVFGAVILIVLNFNLLDWIE